MCNNTNDKGPAAPYLLGNALTIRGLRPLISWPWARVILPLPNNIYQGRWPWGYNNIGPRPTGPEGPGLGVIPPWPKGPEGPGQGLAESLGPRVNTTWP